jgi:hypothetical protein
MKNRYEVRNTGPMASLTSVSFSTEDEAHKVFDRWTAGPTEVVQLIDHRRPKNWELGRKAGKLA